MVIASLAPLSFVDIHLLNEVHLAIVLATLLTTSIKQTLDLHLVISNSNFIYYKLFSCY